MAIKIHPGIGVARIGDSSEVFVGPETPFATTAPAGGFRDADCRIKRQAALFRVYEHHADGTVSELTVSATTTITWAVRIRRTVFDDAEVTISGPGPVPVTSTGTTLVELQTDSAGRLLVCPAQATIGPALDSRCEGYVHASVVRDGVPLAVDASWVVIYPPDFAPALNPSSGGAAGTLLALWPTAPATSPALPETDQLDRGPLSFVGPWDIYNAFLALTGAAFQEPFRFVAAGPPSSLRNPGYGDWASDLYGIPTDTYCGCTYPSWVSSVGVDGASSLPTGRKGADWKLRGFVAVQPDSSLKYVDWCPVITAPAQVNFFQVPRGSERAVPIQLELKNFPEVTNVSSSVLGQPNAWLASASWDTPIVDENDTTAATVWAFFRADATTPLGMASGTIELRFDERHVVSIPLQAEGVEPTRVAAALVLDCSTSMDLSRGDRRSRLDGLKDAVNVFVDVARPGTAIAVAPFSTTALPALSPQILGSGDVVDEASGGARRTVRDFMQALTTVDLTSIGAGIVSGQGQVSSAAVAAFEQKALIVVTDGYETAYPYIHDIADTITARMFAIGIGPAFAPALDEIVGATGGFVSIMGSPVSATNRFHLEKYFLQILAGVSADDVMVDPEGELAPGAVHRSPFLVSDADLGLNVIVVSDVAATLSISVKGPTGQLLSLEQLRSSGHCRVTRTARVGHVELPVQFDAGTGPWGPGTWTIVLENRSPAPVGSLTHGHANQASHGLPKQSAAYLAMVTTSSALRLNPSLRRSGSQLVVEAALSYGGAPILSNPNLFVELTTPWAVTSTLPLAAAGPGLFRASVELARNGSYRAVFRARGNSLRGYPFQRERVVEQLFTERHEQPCPCGPCSCQRRPLQYFPALQRKLCGVLERLRRHCGG
jgi:hypothetical protein